MSILESILGLSQEQLSKRMNYLIIAASAPEDERIISGTELLAHFYLSLVEATGINKFQQSVAKSNKIAEFINYKGGFVLDKMLSANNAINNQGTNNQKTTNNQEASDQDIDQESIHGARGENDINSVLYNLVNHGKNTASSLAITLIHNSLASSLGMGHKFRILREVESDYYAPQFVDAKCRYSIFLHNAENQGRPYQFKNPRTISTLEGVCLLAKKTLESLASREAGESEAGKETSKEETGKDKTSKAEASAEEGESPFGSAQKISAQKEFLEKFISKLEAITAGIELRKEKRLKKGIEEIAEEGEEEKVKGVQKEKTKGEKAEKDKKEKREEEKKEKQKQEYHLFLKSLGETYKSYRKRSGLYQDDVAEHIGKSRSTYGDYEAGRVMPDSLLDSKIRDALRIPGERYYFIPMRYRAARKKLGLSAQTVGDELGIYKSAYLNYEHGRVIPALYTAVKLKNILKL